MPGLAVTLPTSQKSYPGFEFSQEAMKHPYFEPIRKLEQEQASNKSGEEATAMSDGATSSRVPAVPALESAANEGEEGGD